MKKDKEKKREPFKPENTPRPPQEMNPLDRDKKRDNNKPSEKKVGDPPDIQDETTI